MINNIMRVQLFLCVTSLHMYMYVCTCMVSDELENNYGISSTTLTVDASDRNGTTTPPTYWEFQIKHIWTLRGLALGSTLSEFSDKRQSKLYKT